MTKPPERIHVLVGGSPVCRVLRQEWLLEPSEIAVTVEYIRADLATNRTPDPAVMALVEAAKEVDGFMRGHRAYERSGYGPELRAALAAFSEAKKT